MDALCPAPSPLISPYILSCIYKLKFEWWITSCQGNQFADVLKTFDDDQEEFREGGGGCVIPLETSLYLVEYLSILEVTHSGRAGGLDRNEVVDRKLIYSILPTPLRKKTLYTPGHFNKYGMVPRSL